MTNAFLHWQNFALNSSVVDQNIGFGVRLDGNDFGIGGVYFGSIDTFNSKVLILVCNLSQRTAC